MLPVLVMCLGMICWMVNAIKRRRGIQFQWIDAFQTGHIEAILRWIRTTLVVSVDTTFSAKVVLGGIGIELVKLKVSFAGQYGYACKWH
jgi:hypothetical protein